MSAESNSSSGSSPSSGPERRREPENIMDLSIRGEFALLPLSIKTQLIQLLAAWPFLSFHSLSFVPLFAARAKHVQRGTRCLCMHVCVCVVCVLFTHGHDRLLRERARSVRMCVCVRVKPPISRPCDKLFDFAFFFNAANWFCSGESSKQNS